MICQIDPLSDPRWDVFVERHPKASIFHTSGWLEALRRTYGYEPVVYTTSPPQGELTNGFVFCRLSSWLTGERLVSLPFSDHCDPLLENESSEGELLRELCEARSSKCLKYIEFRPRTTYPDLQHLLTPGQTYCLHTVDLAPSEGNLFSALHAKCTRQKIRRAEKEGLCYHEGLSNDVLRMFYDLLVMTRRKHSVPPQPFFWFRNLATCLAPAMQVRLAMAGERPVAGIVTLRFRDVLVVKYAASDPRFQNLGGIQWLLWKAIREAKGLGLRELDLGRTEWDNPGLLAFKDRLGGKRYSLNYWRYSKAIEQPEPFRALYGPLAWFVAHAPISMITLVGRLLYRHIG